MNRWWRERARRIWLAIGLALAGDILVGICTVAAVLVDGKPLPRGHDLMLLIIVGIMIVTLLFLTVGYIFTGCALEPVRETTELARRLAGRSPGKLIFVTNPHDEIGELEIFLNELLQRLEGSFVELDRFAGDVSHELRTPLMAMRTVGEVAMRERNPAVLYDAVGSMLEEVRRMNELISRLLLLTRGDRDGWPVRPKIGSVRAALLEVTETLAMVAEEKQQRLEVRCAEDLKANFDGALLRLALMNLAQNALRYSPPGKSIHLRGTSESATAVIEVVDEGPGIALEHQRKVFHRFYRIDDARSRGEGGVGLGLAIVKWAVERMNGTVELESEVGRGSTFRLRLPYTIPKLTNSPTN